jgi:apolipoprotein N-acyltransferase
MKPWFSRLFPPLPLVFPAVISGVTLTLCFPAVNLWPLVFVALVPLFVALLRKRPSRADSFRTVYLFGVVFYATLMWWIARLLPSAGATLPWILTPAVLVLAFYLSLYPALAFVLAAFVSRYRFYAFVVTAPAVWVLADMARSNGELSFPWGTLGYALTPSPPLLQSASAFGLHGLTFLVVVVNALVAGALVLRDTRYRILCFVLAVVAIGGMWGQGTVAINRIDRTLDPSVPVAVVQPNVDLKVKWKPEFKDSTLSLIEQLTRGAAASGADLVIFPETSAPVYIDGRNKKFKHSLIAMARDLGVSIYTGCLDHRFDGPDNELNIYNSSALFRPDSTMDKYDKNHLLPFGEQLPLSWKYRWLRKINLGQSNFNPGPARAPMETPVISFTPLICFESVFAYLCARGVNDGSQLLVNITNDGWFGDTPGPFQHAQMCVLRAVEFRRYLVRSANTGVSMIVDPAGRIVSSIGLNQPGMLTGRVQPLEGQTFYARYRDVPILLLSVILLIAGGVLARRDPLRD